MNDVEVSLIVPTYREADNLPVLVERIAGVVAAAAIRAEIIIVDDASPDDTQQVCRRLRERLPELPLRLIVRRNERGLSSAVVHGMRQALGSVFVVMDADLSHPPEKIPELVAPLKSGQADFVIGSRWISGASTDEDWGLLRLINSKVATLLAWPLVSVKDPMAGFFALHRSTFEAAARLDPIGYKIGLELMVKCRCQNVREIPITFRNRLYGKSKLTLREQLNYLRHLTRLYSFKLRRPSRVPLAGPHFRTLTVGKKTIRLFSKSGPRT